MIFLALIILVVVLPSIGSRSAGPACAAFVTALAYAVGVRNEAAFPGERSDPLPGEAGYWIAFAALVLASGLIVRMSKP